ncbi:MAG: transcription-repair coupling factor [Nevskiaceae bacterium]|nr:MAG: transcription-repair coupling factor [Nevskiaceae bacterium]TBR74176.1 MAG: transcription-repair coupling factor [Nevskiaceae bacterium]
MARAGAALALAELAQHDPRLVVAITAGEQQAYRLETELRVFLDGTLPVTHFPDSETLPYDPFSPHQEILSQRLAALYQLPRQTRGVFITTAGNLMEHLPPRAWLDGRALVVKAGDKLDIETFRERLVAAGYESVSEVQVQGEFAVRGALVDLFPMGAEDAYRFDLFDDEIETIRRFDPGTQRSTDQVQEVRLLPGRGFPTGQEGIDTFRRRWRESFNGDPSKSPVYTHVSKGIMPAGIEAWLPLFYEAGITATLFDYLPQAPLVVEMADTAAALDTEWKQIGERFERYSGNLERPLLPPTQLFMEPGQVLARLAPDARLQVADTAAAGTDPAVSALPNGEAATREWLQAHPDTRTLFVADSTGRREVLLDWLKTQGILPRHYEHWPRFAADHNRYGVLLAPLQAGFATADGTLAVVAEAQVFGLPGAATTLQRKRARVRDPATILRDLNDLQIGAPVVHIEHGVGRYAGLQKLSAGGVDNEYLVLEYAEGNKLYVPVASLNLIHRYTGANPETAPLHTLGNDRWVKAREKAREKTADVAAELLQIQARRRARPGTAMHADAEAYRQFCVGFPFEATPDQQLAIDAVIADLGSDRPMDRVVCGDVGFGKTEIALRAAFVAAASGRQVCVLAPTTLLASQHEKNFRDRFSDLPITIAALSRLNKASEVETLEKLAAGTVDIVIGTHRLLQDDVAFKDLGLLIVDEEQRFGVRQKERIKNLRAEVDLLTLTATPIPRTLNMSLAGVRELSIIATPPPDRIAIQTFVSEWNSALVQEACLRELKRGGQIYFLHNDVRSMAHFAEELRKLVPEAAIRTAHGQMRPRELEQVMLDFYHGRFNLLVCSTIIESGIDVPAANTILIDRADHFGLAQLHQLRGRVGRSNRRAYAYLFVPPKRALKPDAQRRLDALEKLDELGAGFALATQDMEIRGAGELLGENQSGQIEEVGFTLYAEMLEAAVRSLKHGKIDDDAFSLTGHACEVDLGTSALIPEDYVPDAHTRLVLYKRLAETRDAAALRELKVEAVDRFGFLPDQAERLFDTTALRQRCEKLGIQRLRANSDGARLEFTAQPRIEPDRLIKLIQTQPRVYRLEGSSKLHIRAPLGDAADRAARMNAVLDRLAGVPSQQTARQAAPATAE